MEEFITRQEHEEFAKRMEEEHHRQNRRIELLEENVLEIGQLTTTVAKLAVNMESVIKTQEQQGERLSTLENRDGEKWRQVMGYIATAAVGIIVGYIFTQIGM